jgi:hypothetical protein
MKKPELDLEELYHRLAGYHFNIFARLQVFTEESAEMRAERTGKSFKECYDEIGDEVNHHYDKQNETFTKMDHDRDIMRLLGDYPPKEKH